VNASAAIAASNALHANHGLRVANPSAQSLYGLLYGQPLVWKNPSYAGVDWTQVTWANINWSDYAWDNVIWDDFGWDTINWASLDWGSYTWSTYAWSDYGWDTIQLATDPD
jgi:hypothetical protein